MTDTTRAPRAQRYHSPVARDRMAKNLCPECGATPGGENGCGCVDYIEKVVLPPTTTKEAPGERPGR